MIYTLGGVLFYMKKLLALTAALAICCTMFGGCTDHDFSSQTSDNDFSSILDIKEKHDAGSETDSSSTADTSADTSKADKPVDSSSAADSSDTSSAADSSEIYVPITNDTPMNETVTEATEFDSAPFDILKSIVRSSQYTITTTQYYTEATTGDTSVMNLTEVLDGDNAYAGESSDFGGDTSQTAYLRLDGKSYFIDYDNKVYFEDEVTSPVEIVVSMTDLAGFSERLAAFGSQGFAKDICKVTVDGEEYVRYTLFVYEEYYYFYAKNRVPAALALIRDDGTLLINYDKLETTAGQDLLKLPDGFKETTEEEYYDM